MTKSKDRPLIDSNYRNAALLAKLMQVLIMLWGLTLLAQWTWQILLPASAPRLTPTKISQNELLETIINSHWFSAGNHDENRLQPIVNLKLVGIFAPSGKSEGFAIIKTPNGKQSAVLMHEEIIPGVELLSLSANFIMIGHNGTSQKIEIETQTTRKQALKPLANQYR